MRPLACTTTVEDMSLIPTLCDACCRARLVSLKVLNAQAPQCASCGQGLRVIPSRSYATADLKLFDELSEAVADSVSPLDAYSWSTLMEKALWSGQFEKAFDTLVVRWPGLVPLRIVVGTNRAQQQRVLQMIQTIFDALALTRRSEIVPTTTSPIASRASTHGVR